LEALIAILFGLPVLRLDERRRQWEHRRLTRRDERRVSATW
jgi:hypothetical protein